MAKLLPLGISIALTATLAPAQVQISATVVGSPVQIGSGITIPVGTDVSSGFQHTETGAGLQQSSGTLVVDRLDSHVGATLDMDVTAHSLIGAGANGEIEFLVTSTTPIQADVSLTIIYEFAPFASCAQAQITNGSALAQLDGFAPLTNEFCNPSFLQPCTFRFEPMTLDSNGLRLRLAASAAAGWTFRCGPQSARFACAIRVERSADVEPYGQPCNGLVSLSATTSFSTPGLHTFTVDGPTGFPAVLLIGNDEIAVPLLGCELLTTPVAAVPLALDANGQFAFSAVPPPPPISLQAVTAVLSSISLSGGLRGR